MFDNVNYVPILRSKQAEFDALKQMRTADRGLITPLIDILPATLSGDIAQGLTKLASEICSSWNARPIFVDLGSVDLWNMGGLLHAHPVTLLWDSVNRGTPLFPGLRPTLIPVTGLLRHRNYEAAVRTVMNPAQDGVCLRLTREDVQHLSLRPEIDKFLNRMGLAPDDVHLLVDYKLLNKNSMPNIAELCIRLPYLNEWRSFTIAAGSFPPDVSSGDMKEADREYTLPQLEWQLWRDQVVAANNLPRHPSFGDYGMYHPIYIEPPKNITRTANIRYASVDYWKVMRGRQAVKKNGGCQQYPKLALALQEQANVYCGPGYSAGDLHIYQMAEEARLALATSGNVKHPGSHTEWIAGDFNHHLTLTGRKAAELCAAIPIDEPAFAA